MTFQKKQLVILGVLAIILSGGVFAFALFGERGTEKDAAPLPHAGEEAPFALQENPSIVSEVITPVEGKGIVFEESYPAISAALKVGDVVFNLATRDGATLYDVMENERRAGTLSFSGREYPGLGFFVTEIGSFREGNGKYLVYYVNGEQASVGISSYVVREGDVIEWRLE